MIINYVGKERCDIVYFLMYLGKKLGKSILAVDNSITGDLFEIYKQINSEEEAVIDEVTVLRNVIPDVEMVGKFDYTIFYDGMRPGYAGGRDVSIIGVTAEISEWNFLKQNGFNPDNYKESYTVLVQRDVVSKKINEQVLSEEFCLPYMEYAELEFNERDYANYIGLGHNRGARPVQAELYGFIMQIAPKLFGVDARSLKKIFK